MYRWVILGILAFGWVALAPQLAAQGQPDAPVPVASSTGTYTLAPPSLRLPPRALEDFERARRSQIAASYWMLGGAFGTGASAVLYTGLAYEGLSVRAVHTELTLLAQAGIAAGYGAMLYGVGSMLVAPWTHTLRARELGARVGTVRLWAGTVMSIGGLAMLALPDLRVGAVGMFAVFPIGMATLGTQVVMTESAWRQLAPNRALHLRLRERLLVGQALSYFAIAGAVGGTGLSAIGVSEAGAAAVLSLAAFSYGLWWPYATVHDARSRGLDVPRNQLWYYPVAVSMVVLALSPPAGMLALATTGIWASGNAALRVARAVGDAEADTQWSTPDQGARGQWQLAPTVGSAPGVTLRVRF